MPGAIDNNAAMGQRLRELRLQRGLQQGEVACPKATCYQTGKCWCDSADPNYSGECEVCSRHQGGEGCGD